MTLKKRTLELNLIKSETAASSSFFFLVKLYLSFLHEFCSDQNLCLLSFSVSAVFCWFFCFMIKLDLLALFMT